MDEILADQRRDLAALCALRWDWRTVPDSSSRPEMRRLCRSLEHDLLNAIAYRARMIARARAAQA